MTVKINGGDSSPDICPFSGANLSEFKEFESELFYLLHSVQKTLDVKMDHLLDKITDRSVVPMKTHLLTVAAVVAAMVGAKALTAIVEGMVHALW